MIVQYIASLLEIEPHKHRPELVIPCKIERTLVNDVVTKL